MIYRFPIVVTGFIEMDAEVKVKGDRVYHETRVVIDEFSWEFGPWPRVSPWGDDDLIVQMDHGAGIRKVSADANVVSPLRDIVANNVTGRTSWRVSRTVQKDIIDGVEGATEHD